MNLPEVLGRFFYCNSLFRERKRKKKMLGVQLNFDGDRLVVCNNVVVGTLADDNTEDCLGVLRILGNEYAEQIRLIKSALNKDKGGLDWYCCSAVKMGELVIQVTREIDSIKDYIGHACFPMKVDNLTITYVRCKKVYIIKQSAIYVKYELKQLGVIK